MAPNNKTKIHTLEKNPIKKLETEEPQLGSIVVKGIAVGDKRGIEFHIGSNAISDPGADCWFAVHLGYDWQRRDGVTDSDIVTTDGDQYFLCRRNLGDSKMKLTPLVRTLIKDAIQEFVKSL